MGRVLIAPASSSLGDALVKQFRGAGNSVVAGVSKVKASKPNADDDGSASEPSERSEASVSDESASHSPVSEETTDDEAYLETLWHAPSFISSRNLVLSATQRFETLDTAIVVHESPDVTEALHQCAPNTIEQSIDVLVKGVTLLVREVLSLFIKQDEGVLSMVLYAPPERNTSPLSSSAAAAFVALSESLSSLYQSERIAVNFFDTRKGDIEGFAAFIESTLRKRVDGKAHRYGGMGMLGRRGR